MKRRTTSEWLTLFDEHKTSGLSAAAFCLEQLVLSAEEPSTERQQQSQSNIEKLNDWLNKNLAAEPP